MNAQFPPFGEPLTDEQLHALLLGTDQVIHEMSRPTMVNLLVMLARELNGARPEIERLMRWKREAIDVLEEWELVWIEAGRPGPLGGSKAFAVRRILLNTCGQQQDDPILPCTDAPT